MMTPSRRQAAFDRFFTGLARERSLRLRLGFAGTVRKLAPPPLPGEAQGPTLYFLNAVAADGRSSGLVGMGREAQAALRKAEEWARTGRGRAPVQARRPSKAAR
jgi:hypothetical protein